MDARSYNKGFEVIGLMLTYVVVFIAIVLAS